MTDKNTGGEAGMEKYLTPIAVVVGALIIAGAFAFGSGSKPSNTQDGQAVTVDIKDVKTEGSPFIGEANAPVTIAIWFDWQCPFCKQLELNVTSQIIEQYVKTGKVKIVFKDFQFLGPDSQTAAQFARAMWELYPDKYYDWHKAMFEAQDEEHGGFGDLASVQQLTGTIAGVDAAKVANLVNQKKAEYDAAIAADRNEGQSFGINGTPTVLVGTTLLSGAQPFTTIAPLIEAELNK